MHAKKLAINAREGCRHLGVHFYNTVSEIDRLLAVLEESV